MAREGAPKRGGGAPRPPPSPGRAAGGRRIENLGLGGSVDGGPRGPSPPPDVVLSGINDAPNTGRAVVHSGTVGAALTAAPYGIRGLAVSMGLGEPWHWTASHDLIRLVVKSLEASIVAYDLATGKPRWFGPSGGASYSSPQLVRIDGVPQVVLLSGVGATSLAPADGKLLWQHQWKGNTFLHRAANAIKRADTRIAHIAEN